MADYYGSSEPALPRVNEPRWFDQEPPRNTEFPYSPRYDMTHPPEWDDYGVSRPDPPKPWRSWWILAIAVVLLLLIPVICIPLGRVKPTAAETVGLLLGIACVVCAAAWVVGWTIRKARS